MHGIRTRCGSNGSIRSIHSDIDIANNFNFIVILIIDNGLGLDGLASALRLNECAQGKSRT